MTSPLEQPVKNAEIRGNLGVGTAWRRGCNEDRARRAGSSSSAWVRRRTEDRPLGDPLGIELIVFEPQQKLGFGSCPNAGARIGGDRQRY